MPAGNEDKYQDVDTPSGSGTTGGNSYAGWTQTEITQLQHLDDQIANLQAGINSNRDYAGFEEKKKKWKRQLEELLKQKEILIAGVNDRLGAQADLDTKTNDRFNEFRDFLDKINASIEEKNKAWQAFLENEAAIAAEEKAKRDAEIAEQEAFAKKIREEGVLGEAGIKKIVGLLEERNKMNQAARNREMANIAKGQQKQSGKRLGVRSGAVETEVLNRVLAPNVGQNIAARGALAGAEAELTQMNEMSKTTGFGAIQDILNYVNMVNQQSAATRLAGRQAGQGAFQFGVGTGLAGQTSLTGMGIGADEFGAGLGFDYAGLGQQNYQWGQQFGFNQQEADRVYELAMAELNQSGFSWSDLIPIITQATGYALGGPPGGAAATAATNAVIPE